MATTIWKTRMERGRAVVKRWDATRHPSLAARTVRAGLGIAPARAAVASPGRASSACTSGSCRDRSGLRRWSGGSPAGRLCSLEAPSPSRRPGAGHTSSPPHLHDPLRVDLRRPDRSDGRLILKDLVLQRVPVVVARLVYHPPDKAVDHVLVGEERVPPHVGGGRWGQLPALHANPLSVRRL